MMKFLFRLARGANVWDKGIRNKGDTEMTKTEAFAIAKQNCTAYRFADVEYMFGRAPKPRSQDYGTQNGFWFCVGEFNFSLDELSGFRGDPVQQAFAYL